MQPGRGRHFDNCGFPFPEQTIKCCGRFALWPAHLHIDDFPTGGGHHRIDGALASVRHGQQHIVRLRIDLPETTLDSLCDTLSTQALFKGVGGNYHFL
ncbi:hypothetical protein D3C75_1007620 [compost metagenome]